MRFEFHLIIACFDSDLINLNDLRFYSVIVQNESHSEMRSVNTIAVTPTHLYESLLTSIVR